MAQMSPSPRPCPPQPSWGPSQLCSRHWLHGWGLPHPKNRCSWRGTRAGRSEGLWICRPQGQPRTWANTLQPVWETSCPTGPRLPASSQGQGSVSRACTSQRQQGYEGGREGPSPSFLLLALAPGLTHLSPWRISCLFRPSKDTHAVFLASGDSMIWRGQAGQMWARECS